MSFKEETGLCEIRPTDEGIVLELMQSAKEIAWEAKDKNLLIRVDAHADGECQIRLRVPGRKRFLECGTWQGTEYYYLGRVTENGGEIVKEMASTDISFNALLEDDKEGQAWMPWSRSREL